MEIYYKYLMTGILVILTATLIYSFFKKIVRIFGWVRVVEYVVFVPIIGMFIGWLIHK